METVTKLIEMVRVGKEGAVASLLEAVHAELRQIAEFQFSGDRNGHTLQPTALVNEAFLRLFKNENPSWENRAHFFSSAAEAMKRILIEYARKKNALKRGGDRSQFSLSATEVNHVAKLEEVVWVADALDDFQTQHPVKHDLVKLRYFAGMTIVEAAKVLNISVPTANRYWAFAKAWLCHWIQQRNER